MLSRSNVLDYVKETYDVNPDYPWEKFSNYAALRHKDTGKWFGLIMDITEDKIGVKGNKKIDVLNVKARKELIGSLRKNENIYPAYHMDKDNWVSIVLYIVHNIEVRREMINSIQFSLRYSYDFLHYGYCW